MIKNRNWARLGMVIGGLISNYVSTVYFAALPPGSVPMLSVLLMGAAWLGWMALLMIGVKRRFVGDVGWIVSGLAAVCLAASLGSHIIRF